jgi:hypothetical protein
LQKIPADKGGHDIRKRIADTMVTCGHAGRHTLVDFQTAGMEVLEEIVRPPDLIDSVLDVRSDLSRPLGEGCSLRLWRSCDWAVARASCPRAFVRSGFGVAGSCTQISICPIHRLLRSRTHYFHLQISRAVGRKRPWRGNVQTFPFRQSPVGVMPNLMHTMYRFCYGRFFANTLVE